MSDAGSKDKAVTPVSNPLNRGEVMGDIGLYEVLAVDIKAYIPIQQRQTDYSQERLTITVISIMSCTVLKGLITAHITILPFFGRREQEGAREIFTTLHLLNFTLRWILIPHTVFLLNESHYRLPLASSGKRKSEKLVSCLEDTVLNLSAI